MSEGGQRGTGDDYVLYLFFIIGMVRRAGGRQNRLVRLLEELVRTEMALNSRPG